MDNQKQDLKKQIIFFTIILIVVIVLAVIVNIDTKQEENTILDNEIVYEINGITEEELELWKDQIDQNTYNEYKALFEDYKNGDALYTPEEEMIDEEDKMTDEELDEKIDNMLKDENGTYYYYQTEDGQNTNIKIYTDMELYN